MDETLTDSWGSTAKRVVQYFKEETRGKIKKRLVKAESAIYQVLIMLAGTVINILHPLSHLIFTKTL